MSKPRRDAGLRRRAEKRLGRTGPPAHSDGELDPRRLLHELQVHQIELELQNEELRSSRGELETALARYTQLFDFAPVGYLVVGGDGAVRKLNFAAARLLGKERGRLVGTDLEAHVAGEDRGRFARFLAAAMTGVAHVEACELRLSPSPPPGEAREIRITAAGMDEPGAVAALLVLEDVTTRRRAEAALREESRHKDEFLATLSHELRNPLGPIRNGLFLLEHVRPGSEEAARATAVVHRQLGHLTRMVEDLLDVTRIARGKVQLVRAPVELGELVRRTLDDHRPGFEALGLALEARVEDGPHWVHGDVTRLVQVLGNLLGNAEKFTERGGRIVVSLRREGALAVLSIRDTGVGIDPELRAHLFEPFSQGRQALDRTRGGLGLGLAMVKGLVQLHGGTVELASEGPGQGAELTVRLPLAAAPELVPVREGTHPAVHHRVLVIEDNEDAATTLKQVLELCGHDVQLAADGQSGLTAAHAQRPEIVICDIGLPGMDGYQVARALRADADEAVRDAFLIALTGYARPDDARRAAEAGFDRHVGKPVPVEALESLLSSVPAR